MALTLLPDTRRTTAEARRRGRPCLTESEADVSRMVECARARLLYGATRAKVADYYGVSVSTIIRWTNRALELDGPAADALRRLASRRHAG